MQEAEHRGYRLGNREKAQLADGYRDRGDRLWWDSRNVRGLPQEKDQIQKAADDYRRALELYQSIVPYSNANVNIARVQTSLSGIEYRLAELQSGLKPPQEGLPGRHLAAVQAGWPAHLVWRRGEPVAGRVGGGVGCPCRRFRAAPDTLGRPRRDSGDRVNDLVHGLLGPPQQSADRQL